MAIDYSHIPIWLRCTNRHLIDPEQWDIYSCKRSGGYVFDETKKAKILALRQEGASYTKIAAEVHCAIKTVSRVCKELEDGRRPNG